MPVFHENVKEFKRCLLGGYMLFCKQLRGIHKLEMCSETKFLMSLGYVHFLFAPEIMLSKYKNCYNGCTRQYCTELEQPKGKLDLFQKWRFLEDMCKCHMMGSCLVISRPGKLTFLSRNVISTWYYIIEQWGERE